MNGMLKCERLYLPYNFPKKNEMNIRMKEERPKGERDIKSKSIPDIKPKTIAKREPLLMATNVIKTNKRSAVTKKKRNM